MSDPYRHHCATADVLYDEGQAVVFFEAGERLWVLALPDLGAWVRWYEGATRLDPLASRDDNAYAASVGVRLCPWCAEVLEGDPTAPAVGARTGGGVQVIRVHVGGTLNREDA